MLMKPGSIYLVTIWFLISGGVMVRSTIHMMLPGSSVGLMLTLVLLGLIVLNAVAMIQLRLKAIYIAAAVFAYGLISAIGVVLFRFGVVKEHPRALLVFGALALLHGGSLLFVLRPSFRLYCRDYRRERDAGLARNGISGPTKFE